MILVLVLLYTKVGVDATFHTVGQEKAGKDEENLQHCTKYGKQQKTMEKMRRTCNIAPITT